MKRIKLKNRKGMSPIIEMIFALPLIIGILFAIIYAGIVWNQQLAINNASREAVRTLCIEAGNPSLSGNDVMQMADEAIKNQLKGTAIDYNKLINNIQFTRVEKWANGGYQPDSTQITSANIDALHFHDKILINVQYPTTFDSIFLGTFHPVLHAESEYLVEYMY